MAAEMRTDKTETFESICNVSSYEAIEKLKKFLSAFFFFFFAFINSNLNW